ncbi:MAG TPA: heterodisulfide reductase-related iron-sulfur binding cluster [Candidatus Koribacter sp.]
MDGLAPHDTVKLESLFDPHHPPDDDLIRECVHCGFCLPACPTYVLWHEEMDSPRGRIYLMKTAADGKISGMDESFVAHFDRCLGCMSCMTACPSGVKYDKLIEATRAQVERHHRRGWWDRFTRWLIFHLFPHPRRLRWMSLPLWLYQRSGLRWLLYKSGFVQLLPKRLQQMDSLLPPIRAPFQGFGYPAKIAAKGAARMKVGIILGCVQRVFFDNINAATIRVLQSEGCDIYIPPSQGCCGALATHVGREEQSVDAARKLIDSFAGLELDYIVVNAAGCGSNLKEYGYLLRDDAQYAERAKAFAAKCRDISEILTMLPAQAERHPLAVRAAYHDSCHLLHAQQIRTQPRDLLTAIPGLELVELPEANICCGSAGVYNLVEPATAHDLGHRKAEHVAKSKAKMLVSGNPGCLLQITKELGEMGHTIPSRHFIEVIDASIRGAAL